MRVVLARPNSFIFPTVPPMGLAAIAAWLRATRGDDVSIIDARKERLGHTDVAERVASLSPDVVGIGALSAEARDAHALAAAIRDRLRGATLVMGGPHVSASAQTTVADQNVSFAVVGEGEQSTLELLDAVEAGDTSKLIKGVWRRQAGEPLFGGPREPVSVDTLPVPAWDLLPIDDYFEPGGRNTHDTVPTSPRCLQVVTSRGCPFCCIYCHDVFGRKFRPRSVESVVSEVDELINRFNIEAVEFCDDIFNLDLDRAKNILRALVPKRVSLSFPNGVRTDLVDSELLDLMEAAGTTRVSFAVETASKRIQKLIRKGLDLEKTRQAIAAASKKKFISAGFFMLGFPDETAKEMEETVKFACESKLHVASFFYLIPYPGTPVAQIAEQKGVKFREQSRDYSALHVNLSAEPDNVLRNMRKKAYRRFYLNPRRVFHTLRAVPKNRQTMMNAWKVLLLSRRDAVDY